MDRSHTALSAPWAGAAIPGSTTAEHAGSYHLTRNTSANSNGSASGHGAVHARQPRPPVVLAELPSRPIGFAVCGSASIYTAGMAELHGMFGFFLTGMCSSLAQFHAALAAQMTRVVYVDLDYPVPGLLAFLTQRAPNARSGKLIGLCDAPEATLEWAHAGIRTVLPKHLTFSEIIANTLAHCDLGRDDST